MESFKLAKDEEDDCDSRTNSQDSVEGNLQSPGQFKTRVSMKHYKPDNRNKHCDYYFF